MKDDMSQEVSGEVVPDAVGSGANPVTQWGTKLRLSEATAAQLCTLLCQKKSTQSQLRQREKDQ